jgi:cytoskeletal protein CcmA (bactofilin family)
MKYKILSIVFFVFLMNALIAQPAEDYDISAKKIEKKAYQKYIGKSDRVDYRYEENTVVDVNDVVEGNIIVVDADLTVKGRVDGDILVIMGRVKVENPAVINGNVTSVDGHIYQEEKSLIKGNQIETKVKNLFPRKEWDYEYDDNRNLPGFKRYSHRYDDSYSTLPLGRRDQTILLRYNRVQGFFMGWAVPKSIGGKYNILTLHGFLGYGFSESRWNYEAGIDRWLFNQRDYRFELGAAAYDLTDTRDNWLITSTENSLAAFFLHKDFQDFYRRYGFEAHASQNLTIFFKGTVGYRNDKYESLSKKTDWSLFRGDRDFDINPMIEEGNMRSLYGELYYDSRNFKESPSRGWYAKLTGETSASWLKSDFSFNQYIMELRTYQRIGRYERLDVRLKLGSGSGDTPVQKGFEIGGISTLRGYDFKEFQAGIDSQAVFHSGYDRMLLGNVEYIVNPKLISTGLPFFDELNFILFFDIGNAWNSHNVTSGDEFYDGFSHLKWNDLRSDFGFALGTRDSHARINIAWRTDTGKDPITVTYRISKPF